MGSGKANEPLNVIGKAAGSLGQAAEGALKKFDPIGDFSNAVNRETSNFGNSINRGMSDLGNGINRGLEDAGKNVERRTGAFIGDLAYATSTGNFNNFGNTLIKNNPFAPWSMASIDQEQQLETGRERAQREGTEDAKLQATKDVEAAAEAKRAGVQSQIKETIDSRKRSPGRGQTMLGSAGSSPTGGYTILTKAQR